MTDRLPIFRVSSGDTSTPALIELSRHILGIGDDFQISLRGASRVLRSGYRVVELAGESGGVWAADESQLWKPDLKPKLVRRTRLCRTPKRCFARCRFFRK